MVNWKEIDEKYPSKYNKDEMTVEDYRKLRTIELYDYLPQTTLEERFTYTDIRDAVVELNYTFFGYVATSTFINNSFISYEDKFQSAVCHFMEMWPKYRFTPKYRSDLSFAVFFKLRVGECMERELNEVKYSIRRSLCMEVGAQLGKHWGQVTYDDLAHVNLPPEKMDSLKAMFGSMYVADLDTHAMFIESDRIDVEDNELFSDNYNSLVDMLVHEMCVQEKDLNDADLLKLAMVLDIPIEKLRNVYPEAKNKLHNMLIRRIDMKESFSS